MIGFGLRQVIGTVAGDEAAESAGKVAGPVIYLVEQHFTDHSQKLPKALARANDRAWQALSIALAGDGFLDKIKVFFASGDDKGIREQVRLFLQDKSIGFEGTSTDFRKKCLAELNLATKTGLLSAQKISPQDIPRQTATFKRYADPKAMVDGAENVMRQIADELGAEFPNLGKLLHQRPAGGPPLLVAAFAYFFGREVESDDELAHGLFFKHLQELAASQEKAFSEVNKALISMGDTIHSIIEPIGRIDKGVLDIQAELQWLGSLHLANADEIRLLMQEVLNRVSQIGMQKGEVKPHQSFSISSEDERDAVKHLLARFRHPSDMLLREGESKWTPAQTLDGLFQPSTSVQTSDPTVGTCRCIPINDVGDVLLLLPEEDFFERKCQLIVDQDESSSDSSLEEEEASAPTPQGRVIVAAIIGALCPMVLCCLILVPTRASDALFLTLPLLCMLLGGVVGAAFGRWVLHPFALTAFHEAVEEKKHGKSSSKRRGNRRSRKLGALHVVAISPGLNLSAGRSFPAR